MKNRKEISPKDCKTMDDVCSIRTDNAQTTGYWIISDCYQVTITKQKSGEDSTEKITIPKKDFNKFVKWYITPQKVTKVPK